MQKVHLSPSLGTMLIPILYLREPVQYKRESEVEGMKLLSAGLPAAITSSIQLTAMITLELVAPCIYWIFDPYSKIG